MKVIYIAGPFRGLNSWDMEQNIRRAEELALAVWLAGAAALCPHANTRFFQNAAPDQLWLDGDLEMLKRCDAVILTRDWRRSKGAMVERDVALRSRIPVFDELSDLREWLRSNE